MVMQAWIGKQLLSTCMFFASRWSQQPFGIPLPHDQKAAGGQGNLSSRPFVKHKPENQKAHFIVLGTLQLVCEG